MQRIRHHDANETPVPALGQDTLQRDVDTRHHHDTHAIPPKFVQLAYLHYNKIKIADLNRDENVIDFRRGLNREQAAVVKPIGTISGLAIQKACSIYDGTDPDQTTTEDVKIYEHQDFPGLQITPNILPARTQIKFVSQVLHEHLANPKHKINLQENYDIDYPPTSDLTESGQAASFFKYAPTAICSTPMSEAHPILNMEQFLSKKLRYLTIGEQYDWRTRSYKPDCPTAFPLDLQDLVFGLFPHIKSESGVCLLYGSKDFMPVHRDVSEQCEQALASFSFGCDGVFLVARGEEEIDDPEERKRRIAAIRVRSGDCVHMTGESRWAWHAMPRTISGTCPDFLAGWPVGTPDATVKETKAYAKWKGFMGSKRLNVSCRQVWD